MEKEIIMIQKLLLKSYYSIYAILMTVLIVGRFLLPKPAEFSESTDTILNTIAISLVLICIPFGLKYFSDRTKNLKSTITNKQARIVDYILYSKHLMFILGFPGVFAGVSFYLLQYDDTSLFCFLISFVSLIFSKPTEAKITKYFID